MKVLEFRSTIEFFLIWMNQPLHQENLGTKHKGLLERARPLKAGRYIIHQLNVECQLFIRPL